MSFVFEAELDHLVQEQLIAQDPGLYEVILHNDDFTPMDFVIEALKKFFHMDNIRAEKITREAHTKGRAVCGVYTRDIAETKVEQAAEYARTHEHPLKWSVEGG